MADKQSPLTEMPTLSAPPSLRLLDTDAAAGLCTDGYCVLPSAERASSAD